MSDYDLMDRLQRSPMEGKYFTALFCRYSSVVYSLIRHSAKSPVQAGYLFAITWRHILNELGGIDLSTLDPGFSLQAWLISLTAAHINQAKMPDVESIHYSLQDAPPPLWCYTERALDALTPKHRLIVLMAQTFAWSNTRIAAYLEAEGDRTTADEVHIELQAAYQALEQAIPNDIRHIYLDSPPLIAPSALKAISGNSAADITAALGQEMAAEMAQEMAGVLTIEFDNEGRS
ncbi:MAG: sigma-70 family RNA polymerase sigma factor [Cyanobacteria bacterium P01_D01_bin.105]